MSEHADQMVRRASSRRGCLTIALGAIVVLVGIPMLVCPGPGMVVVGSGFGMIAAGLGLKVKKRVPSADEPAGDS